MQQLAVTNTGLLNAIEEKNNARLRLAQKTIHSKKKALRKVAMQKLKTFLYVLMFISLISAVIFSRAKLTEITGNIAIYEKQLVELESELTYLSFDMESKTTIKKVEDYAVRELGLIKLDDTQIEYLRINSDSKIIIPNSRKKNFMEILLTNFMSAVEYLRP